MIRGRVGPDLGPTVPVDLIANNGEVHTVDMVLDSGFNGDLSLPVEFIRRLGFQYYDDIELKLADGEVVEFRVWEGRVNLHGRTRRVMAVEAESELLVGMNLLWRNRITIDVHANGPVTDEELG